MIPGVEIAACGAVTSVGVTAAQTGPALRGGLSGFRRDPLLPSCRDGRPLTVARLAVPTMPRDARSRMLALAQGAVADLLARGGSVSGTARIPILLALPAPRPGWDLPEAVRFAQDLLGRLPLPACPQRSRMLASGHAGGLMALAEGAAMILAGEASEVVLLGVQSFDIDTLDWMERGGRLKSPAQPNGLVSGEGAGAVLLRAASAHPQRPAQIALIDAVIGEEPAPWFTGAPVTAAGLCGVVQHLLAQEEDHADVTFSDQTGEVWRAEEWMVAYARTGTRHGHPLRLQHPADRWGDVGAASGPLLIFAAVDQLLQAGPDRIRTALVLCASDQSDDRAGVLLRRLDPPH